MRKILWCAVVAAGCSGSPKQKSPVQEPPAPAATPSATPATPAAANAPAAPVKAADATPDQPKGDARETELAAIAQGYADAFSNNAALFTPDRKRIVLQSNRDGVPQVYVAEVGKPAAQPKRLVETKERAIASRVTKDGKAVIYRQDTGADENWSLFRVDLDGKNIVELTPGEKLQREDPFLPDGKPDTMFFTARKMSEPKSTVYAAPVAKAGEAKAVYTDEMPASLADVDSKGAVALVVEYPTQMENYLLRLDLATGKAERLWPKDGKVTLFDAKLSADGKQVYVSTDSGGDQNAVLALDAKTGKELAKYASTPASAAIEAIAVAKQGGTLGLSITAGDHNEIVFVDSKLKPLKAAVKMPLGQGGLGEFSRDGQRITASWSAPDAPPDVFSIDPKTGKVDPLRKDARPTLAQMPKIKTSIVELPAFDGGKIPTLVYVKDGEENKPHPTIVSYHGGPSGVSQMRWSPLTAFWVTLGYAYVEPNVRGSGGYGRAYEAADNYKKRLDAFRDIEASARWVAGQPWADRTKLVVFGGSYGGYTTLVALSRWPDIWRAGVDLFGVVNLKTFMATTSGVIRQIFLAEFGDPDKDADFLAQISPITDIGKIVDPTFVYAGANDPRVPRTESDQVVKALRERGVPTEYMVAENEGHSLAHKENQVAFAARCARFLESVMK